MALIYEWDAEKAQSNIIKHGISFDEAGSAFEDPLSLTIPDPVHSDYEERCILIGQSVLGILLVVVHTDRGEVVRIISARKASAKEARLYAGQR